MVKFISCFKSSDMYTMNHPPAQNYFVWYVKVCCLLVLARSRYGESLIMPESYKEYARDARNISSIIFLFDG
jgi:hypothetical protein